jgi:sialic acid synthase SpsE
MLKNFIQKLIKLLGYKVIKISSIDKSNLDDITKFIIKKSEPVIFDVGANEGQSIRRYKKIFENPILHSFEPKNIKMKKIYL